MVLKFHFNTRNKAVYVCTICKRYTVIKQNMPKPTQCKSCKKMIDEKRKTLSYGKKRKKCFHCHKITYSVYKKNNQQLCRPCYSKLYQATVKGKTVVVDKTEDKIKVKLFAKNEFIRLTNSIIQNPKKWLSKVKGTKHEKN